MEIEIEQTRKRLLTAAREQGLSSSETIRLSVELDHLLNSYDKERHHFGRCARFDADFV
ncbi:aspartyl-phosphate phosphatase Spo0E family protein [Sporosarcina trichiuri]|uniref:aspartyl-phosphate phosphatase Spo0E family protein n=1 Tax=Sporosarcina trichiuri TaxID=3056445 RepID=UPI0025B56EEC|nr:aspartyl-phosphate phosphatase Spo0E family protein [Sporosarcina sp. 0.2-SM1T-5]WJY28994.1 aspartyl-phosphate phosphatase Spo0E family protein [Sporosarcina sp. 0.2-SM1T-5]